MKSKILFILIGLAVASCGKKKDDDTVVSQRYIHKFGYLVSQEDWESKQFPGQIITTLKNGVTITATYENGVLHGPHTQTFPHSQTIEIFTEYNNGSLAKEAVYDLKGMPLREKVQLSPTRYTMTTWYQEGSPLSVEEYMQDELLEGQYFSTSNELEARVEKGVGLRIRRSSEGVLLSKDTFDEGYMTKREAFFPNGAPESVTHFASGKKQGERRSFTQNGEPLAIEEWVAGKLHGCVTTFKNGTKFVQSYYLDGHKNGLEIHYLDGEKIAQEVHWENGKKHGPSIYYVEGGPETLWFYDGEEVSKKKFHELDRIDRIIGQVASEVQVRS